VRRERGPGRVGTIVLVLFGCYASFDESNVHVRSWESGAVMSPSARRSALGPVYAPAVGERFGSWVAGRAVGRLAWALSMILFQACTPGGVPPADGEPARVDLTATPASASGRNSGAVLDVPLSRTADGADGSVPGGGDAPGSPAPTPPLPSEEQVSQLIRYIASLNPPDRRGAYQRLLDRGEPGYDEVFLMGLNEDDYQTLEVVVDYFATHHPRRAVEPLIDLLMYLQGDREMRDRIVGVLERFGGAALDPVLDRLTREPEERLAGGARKGLEQVVVGAVDLGGVEVLNRFLARAEPEWLQLYGVLGGLRRGVPPVDGRTFEVLARRLEMERDPRAVEGALRVCGRLARRRDLPPEVSALVPAIARHLDGSQRRWALYALALLADGRVSHRCATIARQSPEHRFWALQALATAGDPTARNALVRALDASSREVRDVAVFLVSADLVPASATSLRRLLQRRQTSLDRAAALTLARLRDDRARPVLESRLAQAGPADQAVILGALVPLADEAFAASLQGWMELELLSPARAGRLSLTTGSGRDAFLAALVHIAAYGGPAGAAYLEKLSHRLQGPAAQMARAAHDLAELLALGLGATLEQLILEPARDGPGFRGPRSFRTHGPWPPPLLASMRSATTRNRGTGPLTTLVATLPPLREALFRLCPQRADSRTRKVLETILLEGPQARDRVLAAEALFALKDPASFPVLAQALLDPYFTDGPYPFYRYPVRRAAARALERIGGRVVRHADRSYTVTMHASR